MWPFRRCPAPAIPTLTNAAYRRWLRAHRPPWAWFLGLSELEQEQLALIGAEHDQDYLVALGYAVADPRLAETGIAATQGDTWAEEELARKIAAGMLQKLAAGARRPAAAPTAPNPPETLGGLGVRRKAATVQAAARRDAGRSFLGRAPDTAPAEGST